MKIEIDNGSGFCFGVTTAIEKAEETLRTGQRLSCLGDIVHNGMECERLRRMGLSTIDHDEFVRLHDATVLLRAHGEPPATYEQAHRNNINIIDATCPVVLALQKRIKKRYDMMDKSKATIVIFGKKGHAEVLGLVGQTEGNAIVIEHVEDVGKLDFSRDIYLYSQTTKSLDEFHRIIDYCKEHIAPGATFLSFDTICRQVANRMPNICQFATRHDMVLFVCGRKSSNGRVLFNACKKHNPNTYLVESPDEICAQWLHGVNSVGICGATSTPKWLMEQCRDRIETLTGNITLIETNNKEMRKIVVAIDGHSSCGKSTMAKDLAKEVGYIYVDTGAMYRMVTLYCMRHKLFDSCGDVLVEQLQEAMRHITVSFKLNEHTGRPDAYLNGELVENEIRSIDVSNKVSKVAAIPFVREAMVEQQRVMGKEKGIVMDGRDIGTTVFPDAELKIFVTASAEVRAQRRYDELKAKGMPAEYEDILKNVQERDYIDSHREVSPLRQAEDALLLDNSDMTIPEQKEWLMQRFRERVQA